MIFAGPPPPPSAAYFDPLFINFSNFTRDYKEVHKYIIDGWYFITVASQYTIHDIVQYTRNTNVEQS